MYHRIEGEGNINRVPGSQRKNAVLEVKFSEN